VRYSFKRMFICSVFAAITLSVIAIVNLEHAIDNWSGPLISSLFSKDDYEYSISIPDYWERYYPSDTSDLIDSTLEDKIIYSGNNSEYLILSVSEYPAVYDPELYKTYMAMEVYGEYGIESETEYLKHNNKNIYYIHFELSGINYVIGFVENKGFIIDFEYKRPSTNNINEGLYTIISSIERFKVKEVDINGQVNAE